MDGKVSSLIIARSAQVRGTLVVLLQSIPQVETIHQAVDAPSALGRGLEVQPALILLDYEPPDSDLRTTLGQIKAGWPLARCVVFVDDEQDRVRVLEAGADVVLVKGIRADVILETIEGLLSEDKPGAGEFSG